MEKCVSKISTPIKLPESSTVTYKESEEFHNQLSKLENQYKKLNDRSITKNDLINTQITLHHMENKMDEKME
jgi:hypothetical protein